MDSDGDEEISPENGSQDENVSEESNTRSSSIAWKYFNITNAERKIACCKVCSISFSYNSSVSNLVKHLRRKHSLDNTEDGSLLKIRRLSALSRPPAVHSAVWAFFEKSHSGQKTARCIICKAVLSYLATTSNLKRHLARRHPMTLTSDDEDTKKIIVSTGDQLFEVDPLMMPRKSIDGQKRGGSNKNDAEMKTEIYLDDYEASDNQTGILEEVEAKQKTKRLKSTPRSSLALDNDSENESSLHNKFERDSDSLEHYGKYLVALLRKLPEEASNRLQVDFITQAMNAQQDCNRFREMADSETVKHNGQSSV